MNGKLSFTKTTVIRHLLFYLSIALLLACQTGCEEQQASAADESNKVQQPLRDMVRAEVTRQLSQVESLEKGAIGTAPSEPLTPPKQVPKALTPPLEVIPDQDDIAQAALVCDSSNAGTDLLCRVCRALNFDLVTLGATICKPWLQCRL